MTRLRTISRAATGGRLVAGSLESFGHWQELNRPDLKRTLAGFRSVHIIDLLVEDRVLWTLPRGQ